jgi:acyl-CoA synthetase (AMP-forming)/AMP-acid ligase II
MGPGVAQECVETKDGLHIWEDHFYPEIIDPETGAVLPDGEKGELVFTSLTKEAMPVIRYRTRDLTRLLPGTARPMRRMEKVTGRSDDMMILRGVNVFPTQIEEATDVTKAAIARAEQVKDLNALDHPEQGRRLAAAAEIDEGRTGPLPLAGLPIVVKDNINTADMPTSGGTPALQNARQPENAMRHRWTGS